MRKKRKTEVGSPRAAVTNHGEKEREKERKDKSQFFFFWKYVC
jgi:hypothetical protein